MNKRVSSITVMLVITLLIAGCAAPAEQTIPTAETLPTLSAPTQTAQVPTEAAPSATSELPVTGSEGTITTPAADGEVTPNAPGEAVVFSFSPGEGKARYRVREQLVNLTLPNDAVGETDQISGSVTILPDGTVDPSTSRFEVDLSTLVSDQSRRDNYLRQNVLQTDQYPTAVFVPKRFNGLTWPPAADGELQFQLVGDLTIRDVTREVTWDITGTLQDGIGTGQAVTRFTFADFSLTQPRVPVVLSIEDEIVLEVDGTIRAPEGN